MKWENATNDEIDSLLTNNTWTLVTKPENRNIDCKWIFTINNDEFGNPFKYKARVVACGFSQEYLIDFNETFAPVARISSFRFIILGYLESIFWVLTVDGIGGGMLWRAEPFWR